MQPATTKIAAAFDCEQHKTDEQSTLVSRTAQWHRGLQPAQLPAPLASISRVLRDISSEPPRIGRHRPSNAFDARSTDLLGQKSLSRRSGENPGVADEDKSEDRRSTVYTTMPRTAEDLAMQQDDKAMAMHPVTSRRPRADTPFSLMPSGNGAWQEEADSKALPAASGVSEMRGRSNAMYVKGTAEVSPVQTQG
jgi:hypothetical protein